MPDRGAEPPCPIPPDENRRQAPYAAAVQDHGLLLVLSRDWTIRQVSANAARWLGLPAEELAGRPLRGTFTDEAVHAIRNAVQSLGAAEIRERIFDLDLTGSGTLCDLAVHRSGGAILVEGEPLEAPAGAVEFWRVQSALARLRGCADMRALLRDAARLLQSMTGFDRAMVCQFDEDGSGRIVAEALRGAHDSMLDRHFPAAEAMAPAQALHRRCRLRSIADRDGEAVALVPAAAEDGSAADLSLSMLRAVAPEDLLCLPDDGATAFLSLPLICEGRLWGLLYCRHYRPRTLSFRLRAALEGFGESLSLLLECRLRDAAEAQATERPAPEQPPGQPVADRSDRQPPAAAPAGDTRQLLGAIQAMVRQSAAQAEDLEAFAQLLEGRIQALTRSHRAVGGGETALTALRDLIEAEAAASLDGHGARLTMDGPPVLLQPEAFSTLALVVHELAANSARHGALRGPAGQVEVAWRGGGGEPLVLEWRESGGPPVRPPRRRGFGSLIVERAIPYQLRGTAELRFHPAGVQARLTLPERYTRLQGSDG